MFSISTHLGVDLRAGVVFKIDKNKEVPLRYLQCTMDGCIASLFADSALLSILKAGRRITVAFLPWGVSALTVVPAPLVGFTEIFKGIK